MEMSGSGSAHSRLSQGLASHGKRTRAFVLLTILVYATLLPAQDLPMFASDTPLGPRDVVDVRVLEDNSIGGRVTVTDDGQLVMNVVGKLAVAGLTSSQVEAKLKALLEAEYLARATVSVQVVEFSSKPISVIGAVVRPGRIGATGTTTLIQAITQAGGLAAGHGKQLYVLRVGRNGLSEQISIDVDELMALGNPDVNIPLAPNDLVNVPVDAPITIFVLGEVMRPGRAQFRSSQTPTLLQALADVGGLTDRAHKVLTIKRVVDGKEQHLRVDYKAIIKGQRPDEILRDNDTIVVAEAFF